MSSELASFPILHVSMAHTVFVWQAVRFQTALWTPGSHNGQVDKLQMTDCFRNGDFVRAQARARGGSGRVKAEFGPGQSAAMKKRDMMEPMCTPPTHQDGSRR